MDVQHPASTSTVRNRETGQQPHTTILPKWTPGKNSFIVCHGANIAELRVRLTYCLSFLGYEFTIIHQGANFLLLSAKNTAHDEIYYIDGNNFVIVSGMFFFNGEQGKAALRRFFDTFNERNPNISGTRGNFCLAIRKNGMLILLTDLFNTCKLYHNPEKTVFSNLFIAVANASETTSVDIQGCYEYVWSCSPFADRTFLTSVKTLDLEHAFEVNESVRTLRLPAVNFRETQTVGDSMEAYVDLHLDRLRSVISEYRQWFGDRITLSLSGGYDSRLLLAMFLEAGVRPRPFTYAICGSPDSELATIVAHAAGLDCEVIDKSEPPVVPIDLFPLCVTENYAKLDGWDCVEGVLDPGVDVADRQARIAGGLVKVNGVGGDMLRNILYLLGRNTYTLREMVWVRYSTYSLAACSPRFDVEAFEKGIEDALGRAIGATGPTITREEVELVHPLFHCRYKNARVQAGNLLAGPSLFPFFEPSVIQGTCDIPLQYKSYGRLEGAMIRKVNPTLAALPSSYSHSFAADPPWKYIALSQIGFRRPPWLRRMSYRMQDWMVRNRLKSRPFPYYLSEPYLKTIIDTDFPYMRNLFRIDAISDPEVLTRVATVEFFCQRLGARAV